MSDLSSLPADVQDAVHREILELYLASGGEDIDCAIRRDRKVVAEHEREVDHVATLPFDKPYRWRIAPSVGLRAQNDLERQQKRSLEMWAVCKADVLRRRGHTAKPSAAPGDGATALQVEQLDTFISEAMGALDEWNKERSEPSPPADLAAA